jgi:hypothetical protein
MVKPKQKKPIEEVLAEEDAINALRIQQNQEYEKSSLENLYNMEQNIPRAVPMYKSSEEEARDVILQQQTALNNLKKIMKDDDAFTSLNELRENGDIIDFNRFFELLQRDITGIKNISPVIFANIWTRFKEKLNKSGDTGIFVNAEAGEYKTALDNIQKQISGLPSLTGATTTTPAISAPVSISTREVEDFFKDMRKMATELVDILNNNPDKISEIFEKYLTPEDEKDGQIKIYSAKGEPKTYGLTKDKKKGEYYTNPHKTMQIQYIILKHFNVPLGKSIEKETGGNYKLKDAGEGAAPKSFVITLIEKEILRRATKTATPPTISPASPTPTSILTLLPATPTGTTPPSTPTATTPTTGTGVEILRANNLESKNLHTKPTNNNKNDFNPNWGAYMINIKQLQRGTLSVYRNKNTLIRGFYNGSISSDLQNLIMGMLYDEKYNDKLYDKLDDEEKDIMSDLLRILNNNKIGYTKMDKLQKLTYMKDRRDKAERDEDIKRFKLLKSHILAGNNNPEILKELKILLVQLRKKNFISLKDYNAILEILFVMT